jgi:CHAT domain-containing protein
MQLPHLRPFQRFLSYLGLGIGTIALILCLQLNILPGNARLSPDRPASAEPDPPTFGTRGDLTAQATPSTSPTLQLVQQGKSLYQKGQLQQAITVWKQAVDTFAAQNDRLHQAMTLSYLAQAYQYVGQWEQANAAIVQSLELLKPGTPGLVGDRWPVLAEAQTIQGSLQFNQGNAADAFTSWRQAATAFQQAGNQAGVVRSQINQSRALISLGLYKRANQTLEALYRKQPPEPSLQLAILLNYGETLRLMGQLKPDSLATAQSKGWPDPNSKAILQQALELAQKLNSPTDITAAQISLGNTYRALYQQQKRLQSNPACPDPEVLKYRQLAQESYQAAVAETNSPTSKIQALLNQQSLFLLPQSDTETINPEQAQQVAAIAPQIQSQLDRLPLNRTTLYARIQLAHNLLKLDQGAAQLKAAGYSNQAAQLLELAVKQADTLGDRPAQSYALGYLGQAYEQQQQGSNAQTLTKQALLLTTRALDLAKTINAPEIAYRWFWQLGRLDRESDRSRAIPNYRAAYQTLQAFRQNLPADNPDLQFSFQEHPVEPIYREFVDLLLQSQAAGAKELQGTDQGENSSLQEAREVMRAIQTTELQNFLQQPCADPNLTLLDKATDNSDSPTATLHPIVLRDRIEVIVRLPRQPLFRYSKNISESEVKRAIAQFQLDLQESYTFDAIKTEGRQLYEWLIQPIQDQLDSAQIKTIVFVLDAPLRNIPMAALYDGQRYLIEKYGVATSLGLDLSDPKPLQNDRLTVLAASLAEPPAAFHDTYAKLPYVGQEVEDIQKTKGVNATPLQDSRFTQDLFNQKFIGAPFQIVHLATHGKFSSNPQETYILASPGPLPDGRLSDGKIRLNDFDDMFRTRDLNRKDVIQLLILSACETASRDDRATLGIAGTAVKAGAKSAIASLWSLDDQSSKELMIKFYQTITQPNTSRAAALQKAQLALLQTDQYAHPRYWAPFLLIGNWL